MKHQRIIPLILVCFCFSISAISQDKQDTVTPEQVISSSILEVDFNRINSFNLENLELQAYILFLKNDFEKAAKYYLNIIEHNIDDANSLYQLAYCYAMMKNPEYASNFLIMAINAGYNNFSKIKDEECFKLLANNTGFNNTLNEVMNFGKNLGETVYVDANVLIKCRVIVPENYNPNKNYSLLIGLHGFGGNAEDFCIINSYIESDDFIYVVPEAPYLKDDLGNRKYQYSWDFRGQKELWEKSDPAVMRYIINVVDQMNKKYKIDRNYLLGFSQGAAYAYATGIKNSDKIDAVIAFGGKLPDPEIYPWFISNKDLINGKDLKIFIAHGTNDSAISYKKSNEARKKLSKLNYDVELLLFEGGHIVNKEAFNEALNWIDKTLHK